MTCPFIICHMVTSIDGRLHPSRSTSTAKDVSIEGLRTHYEEVAERFQAQGWTVGRRTMFEIARGHEWPAVSGATSAREAHPTKWNGRSLAIGIGPSGRAHYGQDHVGGDHVVAVLGKHVSDSYLAELREAAAPIFFSDQGVMISEAPWTRQSSRTNLCRNILGRQRRLFPIDFRARRDFVGKNVEQTRLTEVLTSDVVHIVG
jgi:hypothetical protein